MPKLIKVRYVLHLIQGKSLTQHNPVSNGGVFYLPNQLGVAFGLDE